jgi:DNA-binding transcriptional regulator LsrR (DeoR family)
VPLNQAQIGDSLGMSIVTVNRTIQALRKTGAMDFRNAELTVRDWKQLVGLGDFDPSYLHLKRLARP